MKKYSYLLIIVLLFQACKEKIPAPSAALLSSPANNEACLYVALGQETADVSFSWEEAQNTDEYRLEVVNTTNNKSFSLTTEYTFAKMTLQRGEVYRWKVVSLSDVSAKETQSEARVFFLEAEGQTFHVPFPAVNIQPTDNATVDLNNSQVQLSWRGDDLDNDIVQYKVFLGTDIDNLPEVSSQSGTTYTATLEANTAYFWYVVTTDKQGNNSQSLVYKFSTSG